MTDFFASPDMSVLSNFSDVESPSMSSRLESLYHLRNVPPISNLYVIKMRNIPFDISTNDVLEFFHPLTIPFGHVAPHYSHGIHIPMQSSTGKTISECFVELEGIDDVNAACRLKKFIKGRLISVEKASQKDLFQNLFPHANGQSNAFNDTFDLIPGISLSTAPKEPSTFLSQDEINGILMVCKRFKLHFSRKCAERPFELVISILSKMPWHETRCISLIQRDHLFEMFKIAAETLVLHLTKSSNRYLDRSLLVRLIRAGLSVPLFTEKQKMTVLSVSNMSCPKDLVSFVYNPTESDSDTSPKSSDMVSSVSKSYDMPFGNHYSLLSGIQAGKEKSRPSYSSLFENHLKENQIFPSPASTIRFENDSSSPWKNPIGDPSPFSTPPVSNGSHFKERLMQMSHLEEKLKDSNQKIKLVCDQLNDKNDQISDLEERNIKLREKLKSCLTFLKSLKRRNDELEYIHFKGNKNIWGKDGLNMEYNPYNPWTENLYERFD